MSPSRSGDARTAGPALRPRLLRIYTLCTKNGVGQINVPPRRGSMTTIQLHPRGGQHVMRRTLLTAALAVASLFAVGGVAQAQTPPPVAPEFAPPALAPVTDVPSAENFTKLYVSSNARRLLNTDRRRVRVINAEAACLQSPIVETRFGCVFTLQGAGHSAQPRLGGLVGQLQPRQALQARQAWPRPAALPCPAVRLPGVPACRRWPGGHADCACRQRGMRSHPAR